MILGTGTIIIYNGTDNWDPLAEYRSTSHPKFNGKDLPFECAFIDLKRVSDELIFQCESPEAVVGLFAMKYAFDVEAFSVALTKMEPLFRKMDPAGGLPWWRKLSYISRNPIASVIKSSKLDFATFGLMGFRRVHHRGCAEGIRLKRDLRVAFAVFFASFLLKLAIFWGGENRLFDFFG